MSRPVVPVRQIAMRLPDAGRIRIGKKGNKGQPQKLDRFRFTSQDRTAIEQVADLYGGTVQPWSDPKANGNQFEVITDATEIRVALPPDALGGSPIYELWSGGGCQRRCDGETVETMVGGLDGPDLQQHPCICAAKGALECKVVTRLSVLLPEVRLTGVWRIDTHSWNAAHELPGMVDAIRQLQDRGIVRGLLRLEQRTQVTAGRTNKFAIPVLGIDASVEALAAGAARLGAIGAGSTVPVAELGAGSTVGSGRGSVVGTPENGSAAATVETSEGGASLMCVPPSDDDVIDAEIVEEPAVDPARPSAPPPSDDACSVCGESIRDGRPVHKGGAGQSKFVHAEHSTGAAGEAMTEAQSKRLHAALRTIGVVGPKRHEWATEQLGRPIESFKTLTKDEANRLIDSIEREVTPA